ncbi:Sec23-binding domain of Sec16-domain-containing protein [Mycena floridula]|nr:Sec23-binding domain of Sec16-domain-containing protein [Mycena floridula]
MSNSSGFSTTSENLYAPAQKFVSRYDYPTNDSYSGSNLGPSQELTVKAPTHTPYAPSPSLLGTNDPLGRTSARVPVFSFGFGGKFVTCFHGASTMSTGFDVALSSRNSTGVEIRVLNKIIPESALDTSSASFPGPLFQDPGTPTGLVRAGASAQTKTKKAKLLKYLSEREEEITLGVGYLHAGSAESHQSDGKLVLVKLLKVMIENDGKLSGSPQIDAAVRGALVPRLETTENGDLDPSNTVLPSYPSLGDVHAASNEAPISVSTLRPSALDKIQEFLLRGERRQAYHYALDEKLWAHAMVIASGIDKESWKEVVNEFLKNELGSKERTEGSQLLRVADAPGLQANGREPLRVAYSLLSGQGASAVQELVPQRMLSVGMAAVTPMTPNFAGSATATTVPVETLSKWTEMVAMMTSGTPGPETSAALTALGDQLAVHQWIEAAHVCYLLSPQTSLIGGIGQPNARIILLGSPSPQIQLNFHKNADSIIFSEILEFALSLAGVKGQEAFGGFPHLQAYRFIRAMSLAEIGDVVLANRYCDAITSSISRNSVYFNPILLDQLKGLMDRIAGVPHLDKGGSWMGAKLGKPSLNNIGGWLEGRFTKLVTGDGDNSPLVEEAEPVKSSEKAFSGPFSHYSTISSTTTSTSPSPQPSLMNTNLLPPARAGSAMSNPVSVRNNYAQIDRASSAMDYRRRNSPAQYAPSASSAATTPRPALDGPDEGQEVSWWGAAYNGNTQTPTAATFVQVSDSGLPSADGFVSLMDNTPFATAPASPARQSNYSTPQVHDDDEDLGFGNSKPRDRRPDEGDEKRASTEGDAPKEAAPARPAIQPAASGSWISRLWRGSGTSPGPVKANLGEEKTTFYYDKDLKRWVNKTAGGDDTPKPATPPPPPSRAQTTSPGMSGHRPLSSSGPPIRSSSAIDLSSSPPTAKNVMRIRSNLAPTPESESAPSTPTGTRLAPAGPPPGRPKSSASKRNIRSRYVDVFQEGGA